MVLNNETLSRAAGAAAAATLVESPALAQTAAPTGPRPVTYEPKPLSLDPKAIKGISEKVLVSHYENNYVGSVKRLTAISTQLAELDFAKAPNFIVNGLKREELIATNSMILHEVYFDSLGGGGAPGGALAQAVAPDFGSVDHWRTEFTARPQTRRELNGERVFGDNRSAVTGTLVATSLM
jgi:superoxide dismutase, Fe-Mn family